MSKYDISTDGPHWQKVRSQVRELEQMLSQPHFNLVQLGKVYEASAKALLAAVKEHGLSSLRFEAAASALDLQTPKTKLERFLQDE